ncbi:MAG TPA: hypothetical protein VFM88_05400, partial [Vicinamibacteria bacterium]|nr:hypothetical protein [Vicinamibacteria bacterium]
MSDRLAGLLLFLPVPIVLALFTQAPVGVYPSLALGIAIMISHRLYARPFALRRAGRRCLWCGGASGEGAVPIEVVEPFGTTEWRACAGHVSPLRRTLGWAASRGAFLKVGILGSLFAFLVVALVAHADAASLFRLGVAVTVLPFGLLGPRAPEPEGPPRVPFPVHIQALIGTAAVLWLFRI